MAEIANYYTENGCPIIQKGGEEKQATYYGIPTLHPELQPCFLGLWKMESLRCVIHHPFFTMPEVTNLYCKLKLHQMRGTYAMPSTEDDKRIKRELLCKSVSVPFYIWQIQRVEPNYKYDNKSEFDTMKEMFCLYSDSEKPCQFEEQLTGLFSKIEKNYKYSKQMATDITKK